ncbi:MAG: hypothetical protein N2111_02045 [Candidatus Sumerlaeaceae bacterium]|nr:hypothetical protein [Candidatus Sumerlaeaceae bacterium]
MRLWTRCLAATVLLLFTSGAYGSLSVRSGPPAIVYPMASIGDISRVGFWWYDWNSVLANQVQ